MKRIGEVVAVLVVISGCGPGWTPGKYDGTWAGESHSTGCGPDSTATTTWSLSERSDHELAANLGFCDVLLSGSTPYPSTGFKVENAACPSFKNNTVVVKRLTISDGANPGEIDGDLVVRLLQSDGIQACDLELTATMTKVAK